MMRKNPNSSSSPNAPVDLTSLLDVIFILLFFVIIGYAVIKGKANQKIDDYDDLQNKYAATSGENEDLKKKLGEKEAENEELSNENKHLKEVDAALNGEVVGNRVKIITISCFYDELNKSKIMINTPDEEFYNIRFECDNSEDSVNTAFNLLKSELSSYINSIKKDEGSEKKDKTIIILHFKSDSGDFLRRDYDSIMSIFRELEEKYDEVY